MENSEKSLYHQIHPAKLLTDVSTGLLALYLLWQGNIILGLAAGFVPSIIASVVVMRYANLEKIKSSPRGRYLASYMTNTMQATRLAGNIVMLVGAWYRTLWLIVVGAGVILLAWSRGLIFPRDQPT